MVSRETTEMGYASMYIQHKSALVAGRGGAGDEGASEGGSAPYRRPTVLERRHASPPAVGEAAAAHAHGGDGKVEAWLGRAAAPPASTEAEREEIERVMRRETQASSLAYTPREGLLEVVGGLTSPKLTSDGARRPS